MAIIYSYPLTTSLQDTDLFIISRVPTDPDDISNYSLGVDTVASFITARVNLNFLGDTGTGIVNIDTQNLTVSGTANEIETLASAQTLQIGLPDSVTIANNLTVTNNFVANGSNHGVNGYINLDEVFVSDTLEVDGDTTLNNDAQIGGSLDMTLSKINNVANPTSAQDAATKSYVDTLVTGVLDFKGTFRADTGEILSGSNAGSYLYNCPGGAGTRVSVAVGDYYIVANADGNFYCSGDLLNIGDSVYGVADAAADSSTVSDWGNVESNNIEGTGIANTIPLWTDSQLLSNSIITQNVGATAVTISGDVEINTLTNNYMPVNNNQGVLSDSGFYQVPSGANITNAIGLNTIKLDSTYGEYPDLRVASRQTNDPGVLDLFRPDGDVQGGDKVGILQYSIDDDSQYAVAQIEVTTLANAGGADSGGGKFSIKTSTNASGATPDERLSIDNTGADFSVPINVTNINQSSFTGQVTIPLTPTANTDAASKGYVDATTGAVGLDFTGNTGTGNVPQGSSLDILGTGPITTTAAGNVLTINSSAAEGTGTTNTLPVWSDGPNGVLSDSGVSELRDINSDISDIIIATNQEINPLNVTFNSGGATSFKLSTIEFIKLTNDSDGFYSTSFRYEDKLTVDRNTNSNGPSLDVGDAGYNYPAAWFRNGVVVSDNPSIVQVSNTSMAIGSGNTVLQGNSLASGNSCTSNAFGAFAGGGSSEANGIVAIAYGNNVQANGNNSAAFGNTTTASGNYSFAVGDSATASGQNSMALGGDALAQDSLAGPGVTVNTADYAGFQNLLLANYASLNYADDAAAATGGVPLGGIYHNAGDVKIRLV